MPQYSEKTSLQETGRTLIRIVLVEEEAEEIQRLIANMGHDNTYLSYLVEEKIKKAKRYQERVVRSKTLVE